MKVRTCIWIIGPLTDSEKYGKWTFVKTVKNDTSLTKSYRYINNNALCKPMQIEIHYGPKMAKMDTYGFMVLCKIYPL